MKKNILFCCMMSTVFLIMLISCHAKNDEAVAEDETPQTITPVTIVNPTTGSMKEFIELNATSVFQQKWIVKSNVTGYLQKTDLKINDIVSKGQSLFTIKSKEAQSLGNTINAIDSSFKFNGINTIRSNGNGFISELNHQETDYVQDGEQLAVITDINSFVFLLDLPYEMRPYIIGKNTVELLLPDGEKLQATIGKNVPSMDSAAQTQKIVLKVNSTHPLPENLIAKVRLIKTEHDNAVLLPKAAVLSDDTQSNFWIMKMFNDSMAAKIEIKKGVESGDSVEILSPKFSATDKIIVSGNFGLPDTAKVQVIKH